MISDETIVTEMSKLVDKMTDEKIAKHFKTWNKTMQYHFTDIEEYWHIKLINGVPEKPIKGQIEKPEISYAMTSDDFLSLMRGEIKGMKLYNQGKLKIKAAMPDIIKLQKLD